MVVALGPALVVLLSLPVIKNNDPTGGQLPILALQFAVVCFVSATFSAVSAGGDDRLSSVVKVGGNVFGWGKSKAFGRVLI